MYNSFYYKLDKKYLDIKQYILDSFKTSILINNKINNKYYYLIKDELYSGSDDKRPYSYLFLACAFVSLTTFLMSKTKTITNK